MSSTLCFSVMSSRWWLRNFYRTAVRHCEELRGTKQSNPEVIESYIYTLIYMGATASKFIQENKPDFYLIKNKNNLSNQRNTQK